MKDAADLEFKTKEELVKAIDLGDYTLRGRTVYVRTSFFNSRGRTDGPPRGRGYGGYVPRGSRGDRGDRGGFRGGRSERFNSDTYSEQEGFTKDKPQEERYQRAGGDGYERGGFSSGRGRGGSGYDGGFRGGDRYRRDDGPRDWNNSDNSRGTGVFRTRGGNRLLTIQAEEMVLPKME